MQYTEQRAVISWKKRQRERLTREPMQAATQYLTSRGKLASSPSIGHLMISKCAII